MNLNPSYKDIPRQKLPRREKGEKWQKETVEAIISACNFQPGQAGTRDLLQQCYDYYNGIIDDDDYTHVLRPYGRKRSNFPAKLHNYNIIKPVIDLLLGEKRKRPINYTVAVANPDAATKREEAIKEKVIENLWQNFRAELSRMGVQVENTQEEIPTPAEIEEAMRQEYQDSRAIRGQQSLDYIMQRNRLKNEFNKGWFHFLVSGMVVSLRDVVGDETHYEILNPLEVDYDKSPETEFIEDGDWAVVRRLLTPARVIDLFYDVLTNDQIDRIERPHNNRADSFLLYSDYDTWEENKDRMVEVMQVFWKSMKKVGILTYMDEFGQFQEREVEEGYKVDKEAGEFVEWFWINEVWEGTRIDGDLYINMRPYAVQRHSMDNPATCKLPLNGRKYSDTNSPNVSMVMMGIPYQLTYNIYKYRLENAIAKSKDLIGMLDINMIPKGWDMDKFMYQVDATGIAWVDYNKEGVSLAPTHQSVMDLSIKTIGDYVALLDSIRQEWYDLAGMNRQRLGSVSQYDGKATVEQSIVQSSHITEDMFAKYSEFENRDLQALLDLSKLAWINGKKAMFVLSDLSQAYLDVDGIEHMEAEYGVFVSDDARQFEKIQMVQQLAQALVQNGTPLSAVIEVVEANSLSQIKDKIAKAEASMQQLQQAQQEAAQQEAEMQMQVEQVRMQHESQENELDRQNRKEIALIGAEAQMAVADANISSMGDPDAVELKRQELALEERTADKDRALKREIELKKAENDKIKAQAAMKSANRKPTGGK